MASKDGPKKYTAGGITFRRAGPDDDQQLRSLLRNNPMDSWVNISLEQEPSFFASQGLMGPSVAVIAMEERSQVTVGMYTCSLLPVHYDGRAERIHYLGGLRVHPRYRIKLGILKNGFASLEPLIGNIGENILPFQFTSIAKENLRARRLLEARLKGMPVYTPVGELTTVAVSTRQGRAGELLRRAGPDDIPALVDFYNRQAAAYQFAPVLSKEWLAGLSDTKGLAIEDFLLLEDGGDLHGCLAIWDQRPFKQTVSHGYRFPLNRMYRCYNLFARLNGRLCLPAPGQRLEQVFLAFAAFSDHGLSLALEAIREALHKAHNAACSKGAEAAVIGLSPLNPLFSILTKALPALTYTTCLETVVQPGQLAPILSGRPVQPEAALL